ncbi:unnamed protein product [Orchesella dallaii]|uniref:Uncharacterized protein n=1 Tax=Orchesella dallaii TaxID=48710 RepID=A0ABP1PTS0_9HEXA
MSFNFHITQLLLTISLMFLVLRMCTLTSGMTLATTTPSHDGNSSSSVEKEILSQKNITDGKLVPVKNSTVKGVEEKRTSRYYSPFSSGNEQLFNPFPFYYPPALGGSNGVGVLASSCAYAYPNRRYSCYGLGRR